MKLILTDVDGVLLDWEGHFHAYMAGHGHQRVYGNSYWKHKEYPELSHKEAEKMVYHFNTSAWMIDVPAFRDAQQGVANLRKAGYRFHAITAMGLDEYAKKARWINLENMFGRGTFVDLTVTDMYDSDSKRESLSTYKDSGLFWLEDKPSNAELGAELGLQSLLVDHLHNQEYDESVHNIKRVNSWVDICGKILNADQSSSP